MGAVTVIIVRLCFSVYQIPKDKDTVLRVGEIFHGRDPCIQKGDGKSFFGELFFCGEELIQVDHGKHLLSLSEYVKRNFWGLQGISLFQGSKGAMKGGKTGGNADGNIGGKRAGCFADDSADGTSAAADGDTEAGKK